MYRIDQDRKANPFLEYEAGFEKLLAGDWQAAESHLRLHLSRDRDHADVLASKLVDLCARGTLQLPFTQTWVERLVFRYHSSPTSSSAQDVSPAAPSSRYTSATSASFERTRTASTATSGTASSTPKSAAQSSRGGLTLAPNPLILGLRKVSSGMLEVPPHSSRQGGSRRGSVISSNSAGTSVYSPNSTAVSQNLAAPSPECAAGIPAATPQKAEAGGRRYSQLTTEEELMDKLYREVLEREQAAASEAGGAGSPS